MAAATFRGASHSAFEIRDGVALNHILVGSFQYVLDQPAARGRELFRRDYVDLLLADPERHLTPKGRSKLWQVAVLDYWLQTNGI